MAMRLSRMERREKTRQDLLACFVTRGFHATSVNEVAEQAGYTKGAVYSNFASKEDLFFGVYQRRVEQVLTEVVPGLRQAGPERAFDRLATGMIQRRDGDDGRSSLSSGRTRYEIPSSATASPPSIPASWSR